MDIVDVSLPFSSKCLIRLFGYYLLLQHPPVSTAISMFILSLGWYNTPD